MKTERRHLLLGTAAGLVTQGFHTSGLATAFTGDALLADPDPDPDSDLDAAPGFRANTDRGPVVTNVEEGIALALKHSVVVAWNQALMDAASATLSAPTVTARALSIVHEAMFLAWGRLRHPAVVANLRIFRTPVDSALEKRHATLKAAAGAAAMTALKDLFPSQTARFDALAQEQGLLPPATEARRHGVTVGTEAAFFVVSRRHADGSNQLGDLHPGAYTDYTRYAPVNTPTQIVDINRWQPLTTPAGATQSFLSPHWGEVRPYALTSATQFLPGPPLPIRDGQMTRQMDELINMSARLSDAQKVAVEYWANGGGAAVARVPWIRFAQLLSYRNQHSVGQDIKMFHALSQALHDAMIACWKTKRTYDYVRPVSAIRTLYRDVTINAWGGPGLGTVAMLGRNWQPYVFTPPFAEYVSGHSTVGHAAARVLAAFNGGDAFKFDERVPARSSLIEPTLPVQDTSLRWGGFSEAAADAALSRRLGGIHFERGDLYGRTLGEKVGDQVLRVVEHSLNHGAP